jgi:hypothetical protein
MIDMISTVLLVSMGLAREANPLMAACLNHGYFTFCLVKISSAVVTIYAAEKYRPRNPMFIKRLLQLAIGLYVGLYVIIMLAINLGG